MQRLLLTMITLAAFAMPAASLGPIDDFEVAPFFYQTTGVDQEYVVNVDAPGHVIDSPRRVHLEPESASDFVSVQLVPTYGDDAAEVLIIGDGRVRFEYNWGFAYDLTQSGAFDRIDVEFSFITPGAIVGIGIGDDFLICVDDQIPGGTSGTLSWDLEDWCATFPAENVATRIILYLDANGSDAMFEVTDVRLHRVGAIQPDLDGHFTATAAPPLPSSPLAWSTYDWTAQPLVRTDVIFQSIVPDMGTTDLTGDFQVLNALGGEIGHSSIMWNDPGGFFEAQFLMSIDFSPANGWTPEIIYPPDPVHGEGGMVITTGVLLRDGGGAPRGTSCIRMVFTEGIWQDLTFENVSVNTTSSSKQAVQDGIDLSFILIPSNFDYVFPLFEVEWIYDWVAIDPTGVATPRPIADAPFTLVVSPSVTRGGGGTEIRASRPLDDPATVQIYNVAGRLIRDLQLPGGATSVHWDGRNASGAAAASGPYFARVQGSSGSSAVARLVRVK